MTDCYGFGAEFQVIDPQLPGLLNIGEGEILRLIGAYGSSTCFVPILLAHGKALYSFLQTL